MRKLILNSFFSVILMAEIIFPAIVTIDSSKTYQTIEGLGAAVASHMLDLHDNTGLINKLVNDLGMSMLRVYPSSNFEKTNDNQNPNVINWDGFDITGQTSGNQTTRRQISIINKFKAAGMDRVILSVFSPCGWMKDSNSTIGGRLRPDMYDEFAEYYSAFIQTLKKRCDVDVYAISPQNEPRWEQWYDSCVYSYTAMSDVITVLGKRFESDNIDVKIFAAEDLMGQAWSQWTQPWSDYYRAMIADKEARKYCDVVAVHTYEDGVAPSSPSAKIWNEVYTAADSIGKPVWMTETSGYSDSWEGERGGFALVKALYAALRYGNCSAWVWLNAAMRRNYNEDEGLVIYETDNSVSYPLKYHGVKQYFHFIKPGAIRLESTCDDKYIGTLAFYNPIDRSETIILINDSRYNREVELPGINLGEFDMYRTARGEECLLHEIESDTLKLIPSSITTLYKKGIELGDGEGPAQFNLQQNYPNPFNPGTTIKYSLEKENKVKLDIFNILGYHIKSLVSEQQNPGEYTVAWDGTNESGSRLGSGFYFYKMQVNKENQIRKMVLLN